MSMNVTLRELAYESDSDTLAPQAEVVADSWCLWLWRDIMEISVEPPCPVEMDDDVFYDNPAAEDVTLAVVKAGDLKGEHFQLPEWHPDRIAHGKKIEAFVESLSDHTFILASIG